MAAQQQIFLQQTNYFPGNIVSGTVQCQSQNVQVTFTAELYQHWTTTSTETSGFGKDQTSRTVTHHHYKTTPISNMLIPVDISSGRFQFQLDFNCVPSLDIEECTIRYFLTANDNGSQSAPTPLRILAPMQETQWEADTSRSETRVTELTMCCCCCACDQGKMTNNFFISKTAIALDRDQPTVQCQIDCTEVDSPVNSFYAVLLARGRTKIGEILSFTSQAGSARVQADVKVGEKKLVEVTIPLQPLAAPSFVSAVADVDYVLSASVNTNSMWVTNPEVSFPIFVASSVLPNSTVNMQEHWQNNNNNVNANGSPTMYQAPQNQAPLEIMPFDNSNNLNQVPQNKYYDGSG